MEETTAVAGSRPLFDPGLILALAHRIFPAGNQQVNWGDKLFAVIVATWKGWPVTATNWDR
jgi:hypothetical protein